VACGVLQERGGWFAEAVGDGAPEPVLHALDLLTPDGSPTLAARILFGRPDPERPVARHLFRDSGGDMVAETEIHDPLILAAPALQRLVRSHADTVMPVPAQAEALNNALLHRDWSRPEPVVVYQSTDMLRVSSPGGLAPGVAAERLLSGPSQPRNPSLVNAMQILGLVEWSSRGFDRMWVSMLAAGFEPPTVDVRADSVDVVLFDGVADQAFVAALSAIREEFGRGITRDAATLVVLRYLLGGSGGAGGAGSAGTAVITLARAAALQQSTEADARTLMTWLAQRELLHRTSKRRDEWRLSDRTLAVVVG
jgi:ATP-dependent DNA helicase RecG